MLKNFAVTVGKDEAPPRAKKARYIFGLSLNGTFSPSSKIVRLTPSVMQVISAYLLLIVGSKYVSIPGTERSIIARPSLVVSPNTPRKLHAHIIVF